MARRQLLLALLALASLRPAAAVIRCDGCTTLWQQEWTNIATYGPICMCPGSASNSTVVFKWAGAENRGVFQIPTDACPEDFTGFATDTYKELSAAATQGTYAWQVPAAPGDYWITSQAGKDCANGLKAHIRVTSSSGALRAAWQVLAAAAAAAVLALWAL